MQITRRQAIAAGSALALTGFPRPSWGAVDKLKPGKPYAGQTVKVMCVTATQFKSHEERIKEFVDFTGIDVKYTFIPFQTLREALAAEMVGGAGDYDVVMSMDQWVPSVANLFDSIEPRVKEKGIDLSRYPEPFLHSGRVEGRLIGLPMRCHVQLLFYRKDLLEQVGMKPPATWADVVDVSKAVQAKANIPGIAMYYGKNGGQNLMIWYNFLWGKGADVFDAKGEPTFATPAALEATQDYLDLFLKHKVTPAGSSAFGEGDGVNAFNQGNASMVPVWWWVYSRFTDPAQTKLKPEQIGFAPLPGYGTGPRTTYTNAWFFGLSKNSKRKDAGMEFITWLTGPDVERDVLLDRKSTDVVATQWTNLADDKVNERFGGMHRFAAEVLKSTTKNVTYSPLWPQIMDVLELTMNELATTGKPVKEGMEAAAGQVRRIIRRG